MSDLIKKIIPGLFFLLCSILLGLHLQSTQEATFFYWEQQQLFLFDATYVWDILKNIGGGATLVSQFLVQFFCLPWVGAVVTAGLGGLTAWLFWLTLRKIQPSFYLFPLAFVPVLFQYFYMEEAAYHYEGFVAMFGWAFSLYIYGHCVSRVGWKGRTLIGSVWAVLLFVTMGSIAVLFALSALLLDILLKDERWYGGILPLLGVLVVGTLSVWAGKEPDYTHVFWMGDYVDHFFELKPFHDLSWQSALVILLLFFLSRRLGQIHRPLKILMGIALLVFFGLYYTRTAKAHKAEDFYNLRLMFHYINTEQWDAILQSKDLNPKNYLHQNCRNLALSHKNLLRTDLFKYPQNDIQSLVSKYQSFVEESWLFSQIYYQMGILSLTRNLAFATTGGIPYDSPAMIKILVKSHLIYGIYPVADKFISLLEKTWGYADWAKTQRRFLYNDVAVESDPELGMKRRSLPGINNLFSDDIGLYANLALILEANPRNEAALDYMIATLLLVKDMSTIRAFVEKYYGTEVLPALPLLLQQAVISYAEHDPAYCRAHGVSDPVLNEFVTFKRRVLNLRHSRQDVKRGLANYRQTFWYYLMFSE